MEKVVNACGLTCSAPVLLVKDAMKGMELSEIEVLVDNELSRENVTRFLESKGYIVTVLEEDQSFRLQASSQERPSSTAADTMGRSEVDASQKTLVLITADRLGSGDDELGQKLMISYLKTLREMGNELWQLIFLNSGVKLTISSSPVLSELQEYERSGVTLLACGTCLQHFGLTDDKAVGATTNMLDIVTATQLADKVVTL